ncbi:MAG: hypothetical protein IT310_02110 [Anaerolineales bacterium]|nr:hypothetical protein [Anaerolineales bacterium]
MKNKIVILLALLVLSALACSAASGIFGAPTPVPTNTPIPTNTPVPTTTLLPSPTPNPVLFEESEFPPTSCFGGESIGDKVNWIPKNGQFSLDITPPNWIGWNYCDAYTTPSDFVYEGDVAVVDGPDKYILGLIFNYSEATAEFYTFLIDGDGYYAFTKSGFDKKPQYLVDWTPSSTILTGKVTNHLKVEARGGTFKYYVNDTLLGEISNSDLGPGWIGFFTGTQDQGNLKTSFDNLKVTAP